MRSASRIAPVLVLALLLSLPVAVATAQDDTVTLQRTAWTEGTVVSLDRDKNTTLHIEVTTNGETQQIEQQVDTHEEGEITIGKVIDGQIQTVSVKVDRISASMNQNGVESAVTGKQTGKTYLATRGDEDRITITNEDGTPASAEDRLVVYDWVKALFRGDRQVNALPQGALTIGESFAIPDAAANDPDARDGMTSTNVVWKLVGTDDVNERKAAVFEVSSRRTGEPQPGVTTTIDQKSIVSICLLTSLRLKTADTDPEVPSSMVISGSQARPLGQMDFSGEGTTTTTHTTTITPGVGSDGTEDSGDGTDDE